MKLQTLTLSNFQGMKRFTLPVYGRNASIYGENATGKTTIANAFAWLLTGKSSTGSKGFTPKTNDNAGGEVHNLDHCAEAELTLDDGSTVTLKKVFHEVYKKKRGHAESEFSGNTIDYYINGVPTKEKDYTQFIQEALGGEERMKMLTMPGYFLRDLDHKKRREVLTEIFGEEDDQAVIDSLAELADLPEFLRIPGSDQRYSVDEYRKIASAQKRDINSKLDKLPERIDEATNAIPEGAETLSEEAIQNEIIEIDAHISKLESRRKALESGDAAATAEVDAELMRLSVELTKAEGEHLQAENDRLADQYQAARTLLARAAERKKEAAQAALEADKLTAQHAAMEQTREKLIQCWNQTFELVWDAKAEVCPCCGQRLPAEKIAQLRGDFNQQRSQMLAEITERGKKEASQEMLAALQEQIQQVRAKQQACATEAEQLTEQAEQAQNAIQKQPFEATNIYHTLNDKRAALQAKKAELAAKGTQDEVEKASIAIRDWTDRKRDLQTQLVHLHTAQTQRKRILALEQEERTLAAEFERIEHGLYLCELFVRRKTELMSDRINGQFKTLRFQLFREQNNGGLADCCEALVPSETGALVPYPDANKAAQINSGLEVIDVLSRHFGVTAPIIVDNAESVTHLQTVDTQVIRLVVSKPDKKLRVEIDYPDEKPMKGQVDLFEQESEVVS